MSDAKKTLRGWISQALGLLTGNRRRWTRGASERARQEEYAERAREAKDRQRGQSADAGGGPGQKSRPPHDPAHLQDKKAARPRPRPDRPTPSDDAAMVERGEGAHAEFIDEPDAAPAEPPNERGEPAR